MENDVRVYVVGDLFDPAVQVEEYPNFDILRWKYAG